MWNRILGFAAGAALALALTFSFVKVSADTNVAMGGGDAGTVEEQARWQTVKGNLQRATWQRSLVRVPETYGEFVCASPGGGDSTMLWFRDKEGALRNVIIEQPMALVQVERAKP